MIVLSDVPASPLLAIHCPRPPRLRLCQVVILRKCGSNILYRHHVHTRVRVTVVHQHLQALGHRHVKNTEHAALGERVVESNAVVTGEKVGSGVNIKSLL